VWKIVVLTASLKLSVDCESRLEIDLTARSSQGISSVQLGAHVTVLKALFASLEGKERKGLEKKRKE